MFFDTKSLGFTNLANILAAFRDKIDLKINLPSFLHIWINSIVEYENFIVSEIHRLYYMYEDLPTVGMSIKAVENALNKIGKH